MTSHPDVALQSATDSPGIVAALLVDPHGRVVASSSWRDHNLTVSGTSESRMLQLWRSVGIDLGFGAVRCLLFESQAERTAIIPVGQGATLILIGNQRCGLGQLRVGAARAARAMVEIGPTLTHRVADTPSPQAAVDRGQGVAAPSGPPEATGARGLAEVVFLGTHGLRGMAQLVAQRVVRGLRGGRKHAYSYPLSAKRPTST
jgi:predicted regulator of Ras-like GTPase activity (Roadblock/LC7/MglB family)